MSELATIIEALGALASAITWTVPNSAQSVENYLKNAWAAIDKLKEDGNDHKTLKTCPFCGGEARVSEKSTLSVYWIYCMECGAASMFMKTEAEAIAAWNARVERTCTNVCKEWAKTSFAGAETSFCCSECGAHYVDCESYYAGLADADEKQIRTNFCPNCGARVIE